MTKAEAKLIRKARALMDAGEIEQAKALIDVSLDLANDLAEEGEKDQPSKRQNKAE